MRLRVVLLRAPGLLLLAALLALLLLGSSLTRLLPIGVAPLPWGAWAWLALAALLLPACLARGSPLPAALAVTIPALALALYGDSRLDWLKTLKDFGVTDSGTSFTRVGLCLAALVLVWAIHVLDHAARLRASAESRGVPAGQARVAQRVALRRGASVGAAALGATLVLGALAFLAAEIGPLVLPVGKVAFVAPLLAAGLLALASFLVAGRRNAADGSLDEAQ